MNRAADALLATGLRRVFISLGADGVFAADRTSRCHIPCRPGKMVNTTGCGDAFMAAIAWAYLEGTDLEGTARQVWPPPPSPWRVRRPSTPP